MIRQLLRKLLRPQGKAVKVIVDGENLLHALKGLKTGYIDILGVLAGSKTLLGRNEQIKEICFFDTYREDDFSQKSLKRELKRIANARTVIKLKKAIISGMTRKSRIDPYIIVEIMETTCQPEYGKIILYSGDSDFEAPLKKIRERGIKSVVVSSRKSISRELKAAADQVVYLEDLLTRVAGEEVV